MSKYRKPAFYWYTVCGKKKQQKVFYDSLASFGRTAKLKIPEYAPWSEVFFGNIFEVAQLL